MPDSSECADFSQLINAALEAGFDGTLGDGVDGALGAGVDGTLGAGVDGAGIDGALGAGIDGSLGAGVDGTFLDMPGMTNGTMNGTLVNGTGIVDAPSESSAVGGFALFAPVLSVAIGAFIFI
jgi:hypothetical protein